MSQNRLYIAPKMSVFESFKTSDERVSQLLIQDNNVLALISDRSIDALQPLDNDTQPPCFCEHWILTGHVINEKFITQLLATIPEQVWAIDVVQTILKVEQTQLHLSHNLNDQQITALGDICHRAQIDINHRRVMPTLSQPGLVVLDMDSTSITIECIDEIAKLADVGDEVAQITELAMQGKLDFSQSLRSRVSKLAGIDVGLLDSIADNLPLMPGMTNLVEQFKAHQWRVAIASGGFTYFADNLKALLSLDDAVSNTLVIANGKLTGEVDSQIVDAQVKASTVESLAEKYDIPMSQTIAIGDGANDLAMMKKASLGIAFHAKPLVQQQADVAINHGDLRSVIALLS